MKKLIIWMLACVPAFANTITYDLADVHTNNGGFAFTGFFTIEDSALGLFDILFPAGGAGGVEWTPASSFSASGGPQSISISTCTPVGTPCYSAAAKTHTLFFSFANTLAVTGLYDVVFPNDSAEFQYSVSGTLAVIHNNPEPSTFALLLVGVLIAAGRWTIKHNRPILSR